MPLIKYRRYRPNHAAVMVQAPGGGGTDADATAWSNAVAAISAPDTPSPTQLSRVSDLITAYKAAGVWSKLDREWLYASENATQASVDIKSLSTHTPVGSPTFTASEGFTFGGTYLETNYIPGTTYTLNSLSHGAYIRGGSTGVALGVFGVYSYMKIAGSNIEYDADEFGFFSTAHGGVAGSYIVSRTTSALVDIYKNNSSTSLRNDTNGPNAVPTLEFYVGAANSGGSPADASDLQIAMSFFGGGLSNTEAAAKNVAFNAYMTALGKAVY